MIDTVTNAMVATVPVGLGPTGIVVTPNGSFAYVVNGSDNTVSVISAATNTVTATVTVGVNPRAVAITPNGGLRLCDPRFFIKHQRFGNRDGNKRSGHHRVY